MKRESNSTQTQSNSGTGYGLNGYSVQERQAIQINIGKVKVIMKKSETKETSQIENDKQTIHNRITGTGIATKFESRFLLYLNFKRGVTLKTQAKMGHKHA